MNDNQAEFFLRTDRKCLQTAINQIVKRRINTCEQNLEERRFKLQNSLYQETQLLNQELIMHKAKIEEMKQQKKITEAMQSLASSEAKRKEMVAEKEAQRLNSKDQKLQEFVNQRYDVAMILKQQILEKKKIESMEKNLDNIWEEISKELSAITESEEAEKKTQDIIKKKIYNENLAEQIREKVEFANEEEYERIMQRFELEELAKQHETDVQKEKDEKMRKRMKMAKAKYENYKQSIEMKRTQQNEEAILNKYYQEINKYDPLEEKRKLQKEKEQMRMELGLFQERFLSLRQKIREDEKYQDELRAKEAAEIEQKQIQMKQREHLERLKLEHDVLKIRMEQIYRKKNASFRKVNI